MTKKRGKGRSVLAQPKSYYVVTLLVVGIMSPVLVLIGGAVLRARWPVACIAALVIGEIGRRWMASDLYRIGKI